MPVSLSCFRRCVLGVLGPRPLNSPVQGYPLRMEDEVRALLDQAVQQKATDQQTEATMKAGAVAGMKKYFPL